MSDTPPIVLGASIDGRKLALATRFRQQTTPAEATAWSLLRGRKILGLKFRRQQLVSGFVVDFYCAALRLALELDGGVHQDCAQSERDAARTTALLKLGVRVVRLRNEQVTAPTLCALLAPLLKPTQRPGGRRAQPTKRSHPATPPSPCPDRSAQAERCNAGRGGMGG
jgi:very-short-patch-repair endonuclease